MGYKFEKYSIGGGGTGGGGGIIDVTELPTEGIDENAVYRVTESGAKLLLRYSGMVMTLEEMLKMSEGIDIHIVCSIVDETPTTIPPIDPSTMTMYVYIHDDNGTPICYTEGDGTVITLDQMFGMPCHGWSEDVNAETVDGIYPVKVLDTKRYVYMNDTWVEIVPPLEDLKYTLVEDTRYSVSANHASINGSVVIPTEYKGLPVTEIGLGGFYGNRGIAAVVIPDTLTSLGDSAFQDCTSLMDFNPKGLTVIPPYVFMNCRSLEINSNYEWKIKEIGNYAFRDCVSLWKNAGDWGLYTFNELETIGKGAFFRCTGSKFFVIPSTVKTIGEEAFYECNMFSVTFKGTPTSIASTAFSGCNGLTDIDVPWAEGAVANAPWGATNATIHYNSTT